MSLRVRMVPRLRAAIGTAVSGGRSHVACQRAGFTLLEMLAVITIIAILLSLVSPMVNNARKGARQADCRSNLRQFGIALTVYRADHNGRNPAWMSSLYPKYIDGRDVFICKSDAKKGEGPVVPDGLAARVSPFPETVDNDYRVGGRHASQNTDVKANSYFYEFSDADAPAGWGTPDIDLDGNGVIAWWEYKENQLRTGDIANGGSSANPVPYSTSRMPIIRCWHHYAESRTTGYPRTKSGTRSTQLSHSEPLTLNVAYSGNVFTSPPWWEGRPEPGEAR